MPSLDSSFQPSTPSNMKTPIITKLHSAAISRGVFAAALTLIFNLGVARADETCSSPYLARIEGQEEFVYVWTLGVEGLGDGADKLVTVDAKPGSPTYGKVISSSSVEGRNEAHHGGFTDDRRQLWLAGLDTSRVFIFSTATTATTSRPTGCRPRMTRKARVTQVWRTVTAMTRASYRARMRCSLHPSPAGTTT